MEVEPTSTRDHARNGLHRRSATSRLVQRPHLQSISPNASAVSSPGMTCWRAARDLDTILMAWQDEARGVAAVAAGHDVVMVPQQWLYFDRPESTDSEEPVGFPGVTTLKDVYLHDPVPPAIPIADRHHVLGAQCQLWTEHVKTPSEAEYRYFPSALRVRRDRLVHRGPRAAQVL